MREIKWLPNTEEPNASCQLVTPSSAAHPVLLPFNSDTEYGEKVFETARVFFFFFSSLYARELFIFMYKALLPQVLILNTSILLFIIMQ